VNDKTAKLPTIGLFAVNMYASASPGGPARVAALAEKLGYDSVWAGEHVVLPSPRVAPSPMDPEDPSLDPLIALTQAATATKNVRVGTGIIILPQRNPVVLAKQLASLDVLSSGRLIFGMGVGYLEPELRAIGVPVEDRIEMSMEYLGAMRSLWYDESPAYHGKFVDFANVDAHPRPVQQPIPVIMGGQTPGAHRRAVAEADGWYGFNLGRGATERQLASIAAKMTAAGRTRALEISITPPMPLTPQLVRDYADLGVHRLIVMPPGHLSPAEVDAFIEANAPVSLGATPAPWA
jgi:probable F420-dependent oxidoreductase